MVCATTTAQAMERGKRTLTQDGMLVGKGTIERLKLVVEGDLRIRRDGGGQHLEAAKARLAACTKAVSDLTAQNRGSTRWPRCCAASRRKTRPEGT